MDVFHYAGLPYWGPLSPATMDGVLALIEPPRPGRALDIGCGRGEWLVRLAECHGLAITGVDRSEAAIAQAKAMQASRAPHAVADWRCADITEEAFEEGAFDVVSWLGGPYLGANFPQTVTQLARWTRPGGTVVVGHGFWRAPPPPAYLEATGIDPAEFGAHWQNIEVGVAAGLTPLFSTISSRAEWDTFEGTILRNVEVHAATHADDPDPQGRLEQRRAWHRAQQRWGRDAMGFGLYLFLK